MFLSKSDEETTGNRKLAKELVDKWVSLCYQTHLCFVSLFAVKRFFVGMSSYYCKQKTESTNIQQEHEI